MDAGKPAERSGLIAPFEMPQPTALAWRSSGSLSSSDVDDEPDEPDEPSQAISGFRWDKG